jgi:hypothetical protein
LRNHSNPNGSKLMKPYTKTFAALIVAAGSLAIWESAQAQYVTGTPYLSNMDPATFTTSPNAVYPNWNTATFTDGTNGLRVQMSSSSGFGSMYYVIPSNDVQYPLNPLDTLATLTLTFNSTSGGTSPNWIGVYFGLNDNAGFTGNLGGYGGAGNPGNPSNWLWNGNTLTINATLPAAQLTAVQAGTDAIYSFNLGIDASPLPSPGAYDVTFNSLVISPIPEPTAAALFGFGAAAFLVFRRRSP